MEEALVALGFCGNFIFGEHGIVFSRNEDCIFHSVLGTAGMNGNAVYRDKRTCRIEVFIFKLAERAAVDSVGIIRAEAGNIEVICTSAYLLIRREGYFYLAVRDVFGDELLECCHNLGYARLVVGSEERCAVCYDELIARIIRKIRIVGDAHIYAFFFA